MLGRALALCVLTACNLAWDNPARPDAGSRADGAISDAAMPDAPPPVLSSTFTATPAAIRANGIERSKLTLIVRDGQGNVVPNESVTLSADGPATITPSSGMTDAEGAFVAFLSSTTVGVRTVTATAGTVVLTTKVALTTQCDVPLLPNAPDLPLMIPVTGDFNGDGYLNLVGVMQSGLGFASGNGDATFNTPELTGAALRDSTLVVGDFNADGHLDVVGMEYGMVGDVVTMFLGQGDGTFTKQSMMTSLSWAMAAATGDFDADGKLDVAFASGSSNQGATIMVLFGKGDGTFHTPIVYLSNAPSATWAVLLAVDVDHDGDTDLVSGSYYEAWITLNRSNGASRSFAAEENIQLGGSAGIGGFAAANLDGNGEIDLIVARYVPSGVTRVLDAFSGAPQLQQFSVGSVNQSVSLFDVNGDGNTDFVGTDPRAFYVSLGDGAAGYTIPTRTLAPPYTHVTPGDFNGDGHVDLAASGTTTSILTGDGQGGFAAPAIGIGGSHSVAVADFTGDGVPDVASVPLVSNTQVLVHRNLGDGTFATAMMYSVSTDPDAILATDLDGDGDADIAVSTGVDVTLLSNNGNGTFSTAAHILQNPAMTRHRGFVSGDFNGDGKVDLAVTEEPWGGSSALLKVALGNGQGGFGSPISSTLPAGVWWLVAGDLDGDSKLDIVAHGQLPVIWLHGNGNGSFGTAQTIISGGGVTVGGVAVADMDNDGKLDVIASSIDVKIHYGNGNGTFQAPVTIGPYQAGNPVRAADVNGDGIRDVITWGGQGGQLAVLLGRGQNVFDNPRYYPVALTDSYHPTYVTDLNGDGLVDLVGPGGALVQSGCTQ